MLKSLPLLFVVLTSATAAFGLQTQDLQAKTEAVAPELVPDAATELTATETPVGETASEAPEESEAAEYPAPPELPTRAPEDAKLRLAHSNLAALATNPLRLADYYYLTLQHRLFDKEGDLFKGNHVGFGFAPFLTPAGLHPGATFSFKPLAALHLQSTYRKMWWFGNFDQIGRLGGISADASDAALETIGGQETMGTEWVNSATVAAKVKNIAIRYQGIFTKLAYDLSAGQGAFYHPQLDIAVDRDGWMVSHNLALLGFFKGDTWIAGARYQESQSRSADFDTLHIRQRQVGPFIAHRLKEGTDTYRRPTVFIWPTWWLEHPYRAGQETEAWVPTIIVGYAFSGALWSQD